MNEILSQIIVGNPIRSWLLTLSTVLALIALIKLSRFIFIKRLHKWALQTKTSWDDLLITMLDRSIIPILYLLSIRISMQYLEIVPKVEKWIGVAYLFLLTFFILRIISAAFKKYVYSFIERTEKNEDKKKQANGLVFIANAIIWTIGFVFIIGNMGYNVTTLVASLGIGGIAIALAAQTILGDLFSYFVIFFDRPFEIGDFIVIDDKSGTIEHIGIKTTHIRTLGGEQLICSNTDLTKARVHNYKRLEKRRVILSIGVTYETSHTHLQEIPDLVKNIISLYDQVAFDRGHFSEFGDFSLNFEFAYYVLDADYTLYMDKKHAIGLDIAAAFEKKGISFAYPTQTLFLKGIATD